MLNNVRSPWSQKNRCNLYYKIVDQCVLIWKPKKIIIYMSQKNRKFMWNFDELNNLCKFLWEILIKFCHLFHKLMNILNNLIVFDFWISAFLAKILGTEYINGFLGQKMNHFSSVKKCFSFGQRDFVFGFLNSPSLLLSKK